MKIVVASNNQGKIREIEALLSESGIQILSLHDVTFERDILEDGTTYEENAGKKARVVAEETGLVTLSDDSGLEVDSLGGEPGIYSARFGGEGISDDERNKLLIERVRSVSGSDRRCRFVCIAALVNPLTGTSSTFRGECEGEIIDHPRGDTGFGYDPIFFLPAYQKTFAELGPEFKNLISHRAKAFQKACDYLTESFL